MFDAPGSSAGVGNNERSGDTGGITQITEAGANLNTRGLAIVNNKLVSRADYRKVDNNLNREFELTVATALLIGIISTYKCAIEHFCPFVRSVQTCLELSFFIILAQISLRSLLGLS